MWKAAHHWANDRLFVLFLTTHVFIYFFISASINVKILLLPFVAFVLICKWIKLTGVRVKRGASSLPLVHKACCLADTALEPPASASLSTTACPCTSGLMPWASPKVHPYCCLQVSEKVRVLWCTLKIFRRFLILRYRWKFTWVL